MTRDERVDRSIGIGVGRLVENALDDLPPQCHQIVGQAEPGPALPPGFCGKVGQLALQPVDMERLTGPEECLGHLENRPAGGDCHIDDAGAVHQLVLVSMAIGKLGRCPVIDELLRGLVVLILPALGPDRLNLGRQLCESVTIGLDELSHRRVRRLSNEDSGDGLNQVVDAPHHVTLQGGVERPGELLDRRPPLAGQGDIPGDPIGAHRLCRACTHLGLEARDEGRTLGVEHPVGDDGGDQLPAQGVLFDVVAEPVDDWRREIATKVIRELRRIGQIGSDQIVGELLLGIRHDHGELRACHWQAVARPLHHDLSRGQSFDIPVQANSLLESHHQVFVGVDPGRGGVGLLGDDLGLEEVVVDDGVDNIPRHRLDQRVPVLTGQLSLQLGEAEQHLDVDFAVRAVHAATVVEKVGEDSAAGAGELDAPGLSEAEVSTLADDPGTQLIAVGANRVVGSILSLGVGLGGGLHEGANPSIPDHVGRRLEQCSDQFVWGESPGPDAKPLAHLVGDIDPFGSARENPASLGNECRVIVGP